MTLKLFNKISNMNQSFMVILSGYGLGLNLFDKIGKKDLCGAGE